MEWSSIFSAIAAIAAAVSAICSFYQQMKEKKLTDDKRRIDNETLWYNKIALDTVITQLNEIIDRTERNIENCKKNKGDILKQLNIVNKELNADINSLSKLMDLLKIFNVQLFMNCSNKLESIRDIYSQIINESLTHKRIVFYQKSDIRIKKKEIVEELWKYARSVTST